MQFLISAGIGPCKLFWCRALKRERCAHPSIHIHRKYKYMHKHKQKEKRTMQLVLVLFYFSHLTQKKKKKHLVLKMVKKILQSLQLIEPPDAG